MLPMIIFSGEQYFGTTATPIPSIPEGIVYKLVDPNKYVYKMYLEIELHTHSSFSLLWILRRF